MNTSLSKKIKIDNRKYNEFLKIMKFEFLNSLKLTLGICIEFNFTREII